MLYGSQNGWGVSLNSHKVDRLLFLSLVFRLGLVFFAVRCVVRGGGVGSGVVGGSWGCGRRRAASVPAPSPAFHVCAPT